MNAASRFQQSHMAWWVVIGTKLPSIYNDAGLRFLRHFHRRLKIVRRGDNNM